MAEEHKPIVVLGATGAVGRELLALLAARGIGPERVAPVASGRGTEQRVLVVAGGTEYRVALPDDERFGPGIFVFSCVSKDLARQVVPEAIRRGARVVDNSAAFRGDPDVPLVVPAVNGPALARALRTAPLAANPNCTAILLATVLAPLARAFGLTKVVTTTCQAVSGAGAPALDELRAQTRSALAGAPLVPRVFAEPIAFNLFSHESRLDPATGANEEEEKVVAECRRILRLPALPISATCLRVAVERAHAAAVRVALERPATLERFRAALAAAPGVTLEDDRERNRFPTPRKATGRDDVLAGRLRPDPASAVHPGGPWIEFDLLLAGDQLRRGAALNALEVAELMGAPLSTPAPPDGG